MQVVEVAAGCGCHQAKRTAVAAYLDGVERLTSGEKQMQGCWQGQGQPWKVWLPRALPQRRGSHRRLVPGPWGRRCGRDAILWLLSNTAPEQSCKTQQKHKYNCCFSVAAWAHFRMNFDCHFFFNEYLWSDVSGPIGSTGNADQVFPRFTGHYGYILQSV